MPGETPTAAEVDRTIEAILAPLREQIARVDAEIAVLDNRKVELREVRTKLNRILSANAPRGPYKPRPKTQLSGVAPDRLDALLGLAKEYDGEFTSANLRDDYDVMKETGLDGNQRLSKALAVLHERGALRLVRVGVTGSPRMKVWEVTKGA